jgi:hypothetical protein
MSVSNGRVNTQNFKDLLKWTLVVGNFKDLLKWILVVGTGSSLCGSAID